MISKSSFLCSKDYILQNFNVGFTERQIFSKVVESVERVDRWGSIQWDSTGLYCVKMTSIKSFSLELIDK